MLPLISIIVPIYKVEKYLPECIDSIIRQTYKNIEIILVDDGSPDHCGKICDEYKKKDDRIVVIHKENGGLSDARNAGLAIAKGEYLNFVDSDDKLPENSIERLYKMAVDSCAQMVIGGFERFKDETGEVFFSTDCEGERTTVMTKLEAMEDFFRDGCQAWAVLYEKRIHEDIYFPKGEINEDEAVVFQLYDRCQTIVVTNAVVYSYRNREESITTTSFSENKLVAVEHYKNNYLWLKEKYPQLSDKAWVRYFSGIVWALNNMTVDTKRFSAQIAEFRIQLKSMMKNPLWKKELSKKERLRAVLLAYCFRIYSIGVKIADKHYT
ncbi:MAG: glycosyltransferase family 2 protein [Clostridiales bacterium]|nr:glycosyltransferase family 2 protein [Clostridiales bacterium]